MTPIPASKKVKGKIVFNNLKDNKEVRKPKINLGQLVRTGDIKKFFSKGDSTNWSYNLYINTEILHDAIPSYRIIFLPGRYNEHLLRSKKTNLGRKY